MQLIAAELHRQEHKYSAAEQDLKEALRKDPEDKERIPRMLVWVEPAQKHPADALASLETLRALVPAFSTRPCS